MGVLLALVLERPVEMVRQQVSSRRVACHKSNNLSRCSDSNRYIQSRAILGGRYKNQKQFNVM